MTAVLEGEKCHLPGRDERLPDIYIVKHHPKVLAHNNPRKIYVYLCDTDVEAMEKQHREVSELPFPQGTDDGLQNAGEYSYEFLCYQALMPIRLSVLVPRRLPLRSRCPWNGESGG